MIRTSHILITILIAISFLQIKAQSFAIAKDDPIVVALDSFATQKFMEKAWIKPAHPKNSKFNYAPDSIPLFDDFVFENRLAKLDAVSPFDLEFNPTVKGYINMYANRKREMVSRMLGVAQLYYPMFEEVLDRYNLPLELKHLAVIESALNPLAKSRAGAVGLWQFMYPTAKMYGLNINSYIDERSDPYKETVAAAEFLQFLYKMFGDWQMVLAAYNGGPGTINHAIRRSGGKKTYWEIRPYLPIETQGYVPAFIAANYVMNYHVEHNIYPSIPKKNYFELDTVVIKQPITFDELSSILEIPVEDIKYYNPIYKKNIIPSGGHILTLPKNKVGQFLSNEQEIYAMLQHRTEESKTALDNHVKEKQVTHVVKKNEKLTTIAKKYGVSVADIKTWNYIGKKGLKPGRKLTIVVKEKTKENDDNSSALVAQDVKSINDKKENTDKTLVKENKLAENLSKPSIETTITNQKYHVVKKGENLYKISKKYGISVEKLKELNGFGDNFNLFVGKKLKLN
jgi:membrane-bound lytic murein transglycosylase D